MQRERLDLELLLALRKKKTIFFTEWGLLIVIIDLCSLYDVDGASCDFFSSRHHQFLCSLCFLRNLHFSQSSYSLVSISLLFSPFFGKIFSFPIDSLLQFTFDSLSFMYFFYPCNRLFLWFWRLCFRCSGAGFASKSKYMFGKTTIQIKLVEGDSAGTVTAFYVRKIPFIWRRPFFLGRLCSDVTRVWFLEIFTDRLILSVYRCHRTVLITTSSISSSWETRLESPIWCRRTSTWMASGTESSEWISGSIQRLISTPTPSSGTSAKLCMSHSHPLSSKNEYAFPYTFPRKKPGHAKRIFSWQGKRKAFYDSLQFSHREVRILERIAGTQNARLHGNTASFVGPTAFSGRWISTFTVMWAMRPTCMSFDLLLSSDLVCF